MTSPSNDRKLTLLGTSAEFKGLETFPAPADGMGVTLTSDEVTALCPVTGQPDWYTVEIQYLPRRSCLESKSVKLYLHSLRGEGVFCEALAKRIWDAVVEACDPVSCSVTVTQKPRGGVAIRATAGPDSGRRL